jgi:3-oxoisoapionate decarboxylase
MTTRREFLAATAALAAASLHNLTANAATKSYGIAYTSFPLRMRQVREATGKTLEAVKFIELCHDFGGNGCQMDFSQLISTEPDYLKQVRQAFESRQMFLEFAVSARALEKEETLAPIAKAAAALGVTRLRVACLSGRRYETFHDMTKWQEFATHWKQVLKQAEPILRKHKLRCGVENHKDWLADEQVELLKSISSPYLGACVDFGNNLALLEDSLEVAKKLAPFVVTTHLKDMAVRPYADGFELSEVALGDGSTPLAKIIEVLRARQRDVPICLEMITRDPLKVPYKTDDYWVTYVRRDDTRIAKFENTVLKQASTKPLPKITGLSAEQALAAEDDNLRRCAVYAKQTLKL